MFKKPLNSLWLVGKVSLSYEWPLRYNDRVNHPYFRRCLAMMGRDFLLSL